MATKIAKLSGVCGILAARVAAPKGRRQQKTFYRACEPLLLPLSYRCQRTNASGKVLRISARKMAASQVLQHMKINWEPTDKQTVSALKVLAATDGSADAILTGALVCSLFNGPCFVEAGTWKKL